MPPYMQVLLACFLVCPGDWVTVKRSVIAHSNQEKDDRFARYIDNGFSIDQVSVFEVHVDSSKPGFGQFVMDLEKAATEIRPFLERADLNIQLRIDCASEPTYVKSVLEIFLPYKKRVDFVEIQGFDTQSIDEACDVLEVLGEFDSLRFLSIETNPGFVPCGNGIMKLGEWEARVIDVALSKLLARISNENVFWLVLPKFAGQESLDAVLSGTGVDYIDCSHLAPDSDWSKLGEADGISGIELPLLNDLSLVLQQLNQTSVRELSVAGVTDEDLRLISKNPQITKLTVRSSEKMTLLGLQALIDSEKLETVFLYDESYRHLDLASVEKWAKSLNLMGQERYKREINVRIGR